jgi:hypothetical protein
MKQYVSTLSKTTCEKLISELAVHTVEPFHGFMSLPSDHPSYNDIVIQTKMLLDAGYDNSTVEYRHYQSGKHFDKTYENIIGDIVGCIPLMCWVSEIRPGKCTPWHWDVNPWEKEHEQLGELVRYFCFLSAPAPGHIFVTAEDAYYMEEQGSIYQYADLHDWHAGSNVGLTPKFFLTITGYKKL